MTSRLAQPSVAGEGEAWERTWSRASLACLVLLAPVMVVAHRSAPLMLVLAALSALAAALAGGRGRALLSDLARSIGRPLGLATLACAGWAIVSIGWSPDRAGSLRALGEFALPLGAALLLVTCRLLPGGRRSALLLAGSLVVASGMLIADHGSGLELRRWVGLRADSFVLNRPALTLLALLPASVLLALRSGRPALAGLAALAVAAAVWQSDSGAARLGLLAAIGAGAAAAILPRRIAVALAMAGLLVAFALAPLMGEAAERGLPDRTHRALASSHARDRVDIWLAYGAAIREAPLLGHGFASSPRLSTSPMAARLDPAHAAQLGVGHPHAAPVQVWAELGAVGAALAAGLSVLLVGHLARMPRDVFVAGLSLLAAAFAVSLVGHGAWQGWWPASIGAALAWMSRSGARTEKD